MCMEHVYLFVYLLSKNYFRIQLEMIQFGTVAMATQTAMVIKRYLHCSCTRDKLTSALSCLIDSSSMLIWLTNKCFLSQLTCGRSSPDMVTSIHDYW